MAWIDLNRSGKMSYAIAILGVILMFAGSVFFKQSLLEMAGLTMVCGSGLLILGLCLLWYVLMVLPRKKPEV